MSIRIHTTVNAIAGIRAGIDITLITIGNLNQVVQPANPVLHQQQLQSHQAQLTVLMLRMRLASNHLSKAKLRDYAYNRRSKIYYRIPGLNLRDRNVQRLMVIAHESTVLVLLRAEGFTITTLNNPGWATVEDGLDAAQVQGVFAARRDALNIRLKKKLIGITEFIGLFKWEIIDILREGCTVTPPPDYVPGFGVA